MSTVHGERLLANFIGHGIAAGACSLINQFRMSIDYGGLKWDKLFGDGEVDENDLKLACGRICQSRRPHFCFVLHTYILCNL